MYECIFICIDTLLRSSEARKRLKIRRGKSDAPLAAV